MGLEMVFSGITMFVQQNMTGLIIGIIIGVFLAKPKNGGNQGGGGQRPPAQGQRPGTPGAGGPPRPPMGPGGGFPR